MLDTQLQKVGTGIKIDEKDDRKTREVEIDVKTTMKME